MHIDSESQQFEQSTAYSLVSTPRYLMPQLRKVKLPLEVNQHLGAGNIQMLLIHMSAPWSEWLDDQNCQTECVHLAFPCCLVPSWCAGFTVVKLLQQLKTLSIKVLANNIETTASFVTQPQISTSKSASFAQYITVNEVISLLRYKGKENKLQFSMRETSKNLEVLF